MHHIWLYAYTNDIKSSVLTAVANTSYNLQYW